MCSLQRSRGNGGESTAGGGGGSSGCLAVIEQTKVADKFVSDADDCDISEDKITNADLVPDKLPKTFPCIAVEKTESAIVSNDGKNGVNSKSKTKYIETNDPSHNHKNKTTEIDDHIEVDNEKITMTVRHDSAMHDSEDGSDKEFRVVNSSSHENDDEDETTARKKKKKKKKLKPKNPPSMHRDIGTFFMTKKAPEDSEMKDNKQSVDVTTNLAEPELSSQYPQHKIECDDSSVSRIIDVSADKNIILNSTPVTSCTAEEVSVTPGRRSSRKHKVRNYKDMVSVLDDIVAGDETSVNINSPSSARKSKKKLFKKIGKQTPIPKSQFPSVDVGSACSSDKVLHELEEEDHSLKTISNTTSEKESINLDDRNPKMKTVQMKLSFSSKSDKLTSDVSCTPIEANSENAQVLKSLSDINEADSTNLEDSLSKSFIAAKPAPIFNRRNSSHIENEVSITDDSTRTKGGTRGRKPRRVAPPTTDQKIDDSCSIENIKPCQNEDVSAEDSSCLKKRRRACAAERNYCEDIPSPRKKRKVAGQKIMIHVESDEECKTTRKTKNNKKGKFLVPLSMSVKIVIALVCQKQMCVS